ncbi:MAG: HAMP domain-containing sensor histidine kinase [Bacillota bacterium]|nr:HAMP domain-containing sensor histidine kinase [Bacillota bacterium]
MEKIRNLSLKKAIVFYVTVSFIVTFFLSVFTVNIAAEIQNNIWWKYTDQEEYFKSLRNEGYETIIARPRREEMSKMDWHISETCDFLQTYGILLWSIAGSIVAVGIFYKNKLKKPIEELKEASKLIAKDELEFHITYENQDEMGMLCQEFEKMRSQLEENNKVLWRMIEDEKALRAAIAHDIRSPLAVLKGYQEMLLEFLPTGEMGKEETEEILLEGMKQIERLNRFIETMRKMTRLEEREPIYQEIELVRLKENLEKEIKILEKETEKQCEIMIKGDRKTAFADEEMVREVLQNLLANAFRYAKTSVEVIISAEPSKLVITVEDDGIGFQEDANKVTQAFYHSNPKDDLKHFGMGMYISRVFCERHGGGLYIEQNKGEGAKVKAVFKFLTLS